MAITSATLSNGDIISTVGKRTLTIQFTAATSCTFEASVNTSGASWFRIRGKEHGPESLDDGQYAAGQIVTFGVENFARVRVQGLTGTAAVVYETTPFASNLIVAAATEGDVRAAIEQANSLGGGTVQVLRGAVTLTATLPIYNGVKVRGTTLGDLTFTTIPDSEWNFDENDITLFKGDGTFPAFSHNTTGTTTLPTVQADFANEMVSNWGLECLAFDNFSHAVHVGSQNRGGGFFFHIRDLLIKNTKTWGIRLTNSMHYEVERVKIVDSFVGGAALFEGDCPTGILQTGNCFIRHIFACPSGDAASNTVRQRRHARGVVFRANHSGGGSNIGILNEVHAYGVQVNQFNRTTLSVTATFTSGSSNVTVPDGAEYVVGMPVRFTTTPASGFSTNKVYIVRSVVGNNLTLALDRTSAVISAGSSTTATMVANGMPCMEVISDTTGSRITNSKFTDLDLEGEYGAGLYIDRTTACRFEILQFGIGANNTDLVARDAQNSDFQSMNTTITDLDSASAGSNFVGRQTRLDRPGKGFFFETGLNGHCFSVGGSFISAIRMTGGDGFRMATDAGFGLQFVSRTTSLTMTNNHFGAIVLSGTTAGQNITLPVASSATGESGNAGALAVIINRSNQNWTIQTQSSQLFNGVAAKTSFTLPAGQMAWVISDGTGYGGGLFGLLP